MKTLKWRPVLRFVAACLWIDGGLGVPGSVLRVNDEKTGNESSEVNVTGYEIRPWIMKCCNLTYGYKFENKSLCVDTEDEFLPDFEDWSNYSETVKDLPVEDRYEYFIGDPCLDGKYILDLTVYSYDKYSIYSNGSLLYLDQLFTKGEYCLESLNNTIRAFICFGAEKPDFELDFKYIIYAAGLLFSIPFLLATAVVYLSVDLLRDLRGKSLSCHALCLATAYLALAVVQLASDQLNEELCVAAGFVIQFFFVAAFFWLNVICYDTWRCLNNDFRCAITPVNAREEKKTFLCYSFYAWNAPAVLSMVSIFMDLDPTIPESYLKPNFGLQSCWFYSDDAALPYFYGPVGLIIIANVIFFVLSARKIYKEHKKRVEALNRNSIDETREKTIAIHGYSKTLQECLYLFGVMGINWAAEVISWAVGGSPAIWLLTDLFNTLQGVMIFYLFVMKQKRVRNEVKKHMLRTWKKITKCDCKYKEENKRISKHWHAEIRDLMEESCCENECIPLKELAAVQHIDHN